MNRVKPKQAGREQEDSDSDGRRQGRGRVSQPKRAREGQEHAQRRDVGQRSRRSALRRRLAPSVEKQNDDQDRETIRRGEDVTYPGSIPTPANDLEHERG